MNPSEAVNIEEQDQPIEESAETPVAESVVDAAGASEVVEAVEASEAVETVEAMEEAVETLEASEASVEEAEALAEDSESELAAGADDSAEAPGPIMNAEELLGDSATEQATEEASAEASLKALLEAIIYVTEEPLTVEQIANALEQTKERVTALLQQMTDEYAKADRGVTIREVAGGFKMGTKPEHHEAIRTFVKRMKPPLKLSIAALETLAVIAYKQPITAPEIMEIRGVQGAGVIKTLLDRKLIAIGGRKQVVGKPILYKTTKEFLMQFGLKDLAELPTLKEFEELRRLAFADTDDIEPMPADAPKPAAEQTEEAAAPSESPAPQEAQPVAETTVQVEEVSQQSITVEAAEAPVESSESEQSVTPSSE